METPTAGLAVVAAGCVLAVVLDIRQVGEVARLVAAVSVTGKVLGVAAAKQVSLRS